MAKGWKGVNVTISEIRKFGKDVDAKVGAVTQNSAVDIATEAKQRAPKNIGKLAQTISHRKITDLTYKVFANEKYAAYVEFGTGKKFHAEADFRDMAAQFKGKTGETFEDGLEAIKLWLHQKGGDEKDAWWILVNLIRWGMRSQPFMYPAWKNGTKAYEKKLKELLKRLQKKT